MACLNETFAFKFNQTHFAATPVGADFGYADLTLATCCPSSPHHQPSPVYFPQRSLHHTPQPFLYRQRVTTGSPTPVAPKTTQSNQRSKQQGSATTSSQSRQGSVKKILQRCSRKSADEEIQSRSTGSAENRTRLCSDSPGLVEDVSRQLHSEGAVGHDQQTREKAALGDVRVFSSGDSEDNQQPRTEDAVEEEEDLSQQDDPAQDQTDLSVAIQSSCSEKDFDEKDDYDDEDGGEDLQSQPQRASSSSMGECQESKSPRSSTSDNLQLLSLKEHYDVERELGRGTYGKVVLARCRHTGTQVALKLLPKTSTKLRDFQREFQLSYFLSPHASIIDTYNVAFETRSSYVFAQEHAPLGDLFDAIPPQLGMREADAKSVVKQLASALDFMHSKHLVHRDIKPENVLVMALDFSRVKLMDFGMTRKHGAMVRKTSGSIPYTPPEVCEAVRNESVLVNTSADVWALAVLVFCMVTGNFPWENADIGDVYFKEFVLWQRRKTTKLPSQWRRFTPRAMKFFRKALEVKLERRCGIGEVLKYLNTAWTQKARSANDSEDESSSSGSGEHMNELAAMLRDHGIETRVDRRLRDRRISEWLLSL